MKKTTTLIIVLAVVIIAVCIVGYFVQKKQKQTETSREDKNDYPAENSTTELYEHKPAPITEELELEIAITEEVEEPQPAVLQPAVLPLITSSLVKQNVAQKINLATLISSSNERA